MSTNKKELNLGSKFLKEISQTLSKPSKDALAWEQMRINDRNLLVRSAQISMQTALYKWADIPAQNQHKIREAAKRAASWVNELEFIS